MLRCGHLDYVLNEHAWAYLKEQGLPAKVLRLLQAEEPAGDAAEKTVVSSSSRRSRMSRPGISIWIAWASTTPSIARR